MSCDSLLAFLELGSFRTHQEIQTEFLAKYPDYTFQRDNRLRLVPLKPAGPWTDCRQHGRLMTTCGCEHFVPFLEKQVRNMALELNIPEPQNLSSFEGYYRRRNYCWDLNGVLKWYCQCWDKYQGRKKLQEERKKLQEEKSTAERLVLETELACLFTPSASTPDLLAF